MVLNVRVLGKKCQGFILDFLSGGVQQHRVTGWLAFSIVF